MFNIGIYESTNKLKPNQPGNSNTKIDKKEGNKDVTSRTPERNEKLINNFRNRISKFIIQVNTHR